MEIELPDGTVLNAPDGSNPKRVVAGYKLKKRVASNPGEYDPSSPEFKAKFQPKASAATAAFSGVKRMDAGMGNILRKAVSVYPGGDAVASRFPKQYTPEGIAEEDALDESLKEQHPVARAGGEIAATVPLSMASGGLGAPSKAASVLVRTLGHPATKAALEGVLPGAAAADPNAQAEGGAKGAAMSLIFERFLKGGGRAVRGIVQKSQAAQDLLAMANQLGEKIHIPLSQAAGDQDLMTRLIKTGYQEGLSLIPGVRGRLNRQAEDALAKTRELALREAVPEGHNMIPEAGKNVNEALGGIRNALDSEYADTVKSYAFNIPEDFKDQVSAKIRAAYPQIDNTTLSKVVDSLGENMGRFSSGRNVIDGANLINVKTAMGRLVKKVPDEEKGAMGVAQRHIDDMISEEMQQGNSKVNLRDLGRYRDLEEPERHFSGLAAAANSAKAQAGNFSMGQLARSAKDPSQAHLASTANTVLSESPAGTSFVGRNLLGYGGLAGLGAAAGLPAAVGTMIGGHALAGKTAQSALMGDLRMQAKMAEMLRKYPKQADLIQTVLREGAASQTGE